MIANVRRWSPIRLPSLALRRSEGSKQNEKSEKPRRLGVMESWQLSLERQTALILRTMDPID